MSGEPTDSDREWALNPKWEEVGRVHDWRNYVSQGIKSRWDEFSDDHKILLFLQASDQASDEDWD